MTNALDDLMFKYKADKTPRIKHHYTDVYYELFRDKRPLVAKVLEIGTAEGASLFAWRDFFPYATIYGGEIDQKRVDLLQGEKSIEVYQCDQSSELDLIALIQNTGSNIDLFVDDGSHNPQHQLFTCEVLMPLLSKQTVYVIEDVDDKSADQIFEKLLDKYTVQMIRVGKRHDDRLIIVRHKDE